MTPPPEQDTQKVADLIRENHLAMLTTIAPDGTLISRPMGLQATDFDGDLWFFTEHDSRKIAHITANPQVNVTVASGATWVSLTGTGIEVHDTRSSASFGTRASRRGFLTARTTPGSA